MSIQLQYDGQVTAFAELLTTTNETTVVTGRKTSRELLGVHMTNRDPTNAVTATVTITFASSTDVFHLFSAYSINGASYVQRMGLDIPFREGDLIKVTASAANDLDVLFIVREASALATPR